MIVPNKADKTLKKVCAKTSDRRTQIHHCELDADKGYLWATNGHIAARLKVVTDERDTSGPISQESIGAAVAVQKATNMKDAQVIANGGLDIPHGPSFPRPETKFPDAASILNNVSDSTEKLAVTIDVQLLHDLAAALSHDGKPGKVKLTFSDHTGIKVTNGTENIGLLMPCRD
jgi:hypothetical protein